jgi:hypothetical protein
LMLLLRSGPLAPSPGGLTRYPAMPPVDRTPSMMPRWFHGSARLESRRPAVAHMRHHLRQRHDDDGAYRSAGRRRHWRASSTATWHGYRSNVWARCVGTHFAVNESRQAGGSVPPSSARRRAIDNPWPLRLRRHPNTAMSLRGPPAAQMDAVCQAGRKVTARIQNSPQISASA